MFTHPLLALLADYSYDPLILLDGNRRVVIANQAAHELLPETATAGVSIESLIDNPELTELLECMSDHENCPEIQIPINQRTYRVRCEHSAAEGNTYFALVMQDITQLRRLNRARRDMVANISHELRTPITSIRLLVDSLNRQQASKKSRIKMLRKVSRELDTLQSIVEGMHDLSMIESGQSIMRLLELPLYELVQESIDHLDEQLHQRSLTIETKIDRDYYVLVDHAQIGRVLTNLVSNAIKASPKKGTIRLSAQRSMKDEMVIVNVDDDGPGVAEQERERIFERFYQIDEARTQGRGSGLGLSIAKHIIEAHQGQIWVEESPLGGARFSFSLLSAEPPDRLDKKKKD